MVRLAPLTAALASLPLLFAFPADVVSRDDRGGCGTEPTAEDLAAIAEVANLDVNTSPAFRTFGAGISSFAAPVWPWAPITVKTWIHVVAGAQTLEEGWIPDDQIAAQFDVLNDNFGERKLLNSL